MQSADYPDVQYIGALGDGGPRSQTQVIVIHATDNTANALGEATYATHREDETSAHYYVDETTVIQAVPIGHIAYGCLYHGNQISIQYELCGRSNAISDATMRRAAHQVARDCARYGIPVRKITAAQVRAGAKGICGHADITAAFPEDNGDHTDPGTAFNWGTFISYVGGDMELSDVVPGTKTPGFNPNDRTVGQWAMDQCNDRAVDYGEKPVTSLPAGSPKRRLYELLPKLEQLVAAPAATVDAAAVAAALQPIIAKAVADELAKRLEE